MNKVSQLSIMLFTQSNSNNMGWIKSKVTLPSLHKVYTQTFPRWLVSGLRKPRDIRVSQPNSPGNSPNVSSTIRLWNLSSLIRYWVQADYFNSAFPFKTFCIVSQWNSSGSDPLEMIIPLHWILLKKSIAPSESVKALALSGILVEFVPVDRKTKQNHPGNVV